MQDRKDWRGISKMASPDSEGETGDLSEKIAPWARGKFLRHVERDVLIPKIVREKSKIKCDDLVKGKH